MASSHGHTAGQVPDDQLKKMVTEVFLSVVLEHINPDVQLLGEMLSAGLLTKNEVEEVNNEKGNKSSSAALKRLLTILDSHPQQEVYAKFLQCLQNSGNKSNRVIAEYILGNGPYPNIREKFPNFHKKFEELFSELVSIIYPSEILDVLNAHLSADDRETILAEEKQSGRFRSALILLLRLSRSASEWPIDFVEACERCHLQKTADLREALVKDEVSSASLENSFNHRIDNQVSQCHSMETDVVQFSEEYMETQEPGDMEICEQDDIKTVLKTESNANHVSKKEEFGKLVVKVAEELDGRDVLKLVTLFCFSNLEEAQIISECNPGLSFIKALEVKGLVAETQMCHLHDALTDVGQVKASKIVHDYMEKFGEDDSKEASEKGLEYEFARLLLKLSDNIGNAGIEKLMTLFGLKQGEEDRVLKSPLPSLCLLKELERRAILGPKNVKALSDKLSEAGFHSLAAAVDEYQNKHIADVSLQKFSTEGKESFGENSSKQEESQTHSPDKNSLGYISKYRSMLDEAGRALNRDDSVRLAGLLKLSESELDCIDRHTRPSHEALRILEKTGKFSEKNVIPLFDAVKELELQEVAEMVERYINTQDESSSDLKGEEEIKSKFLLRDDQRKLAEPGKQGKNYIILAETGFGKTLVATDIMKDHLKDNGEGAPKKKVAFIVEKKSLADQQEKKINEYLGKQKEIVVKKVTGYDPTVHLPKVLETSDILVATAGVIHNEFKQINDGSLMAFSLLIFDECHHCLKGHPFNQVMRMYHKEKREMISLGEPLENLPQIIGMTATLGTGQAKSTEKAVDHGLHVMANLDADHIETVANNEESLPRQTGSLHRDTIHILVNNREEDPFKGEVESLMSKVEEKLLQLPDASLLKGSQPFDMKDSQQYEQWVITNKETHCPELVTDETNCRNLQACLEYLLIYHKALCINREVRSKDAYNFLKKFSDEQLSSSRTGSYNDLQWELIKDYNKQAKDLEKVGKDEKFKNPLLKELETLLESEYRRKPDSLGFLFTATIDGTKYLKNWIEETFSLNKFLKAECVTRETTQNQLEQIRNKFDKGVYNLLIVTSIADEGWNTDGLNLVFSLNCITSDYTAVQRPGRLRAREGKYYVVEYGNMTKNDGCQKIWKKMMETAVKRIKEMDPELKKKKLSQFQVHDERLCEEVERRQELKASSKNRREYILHCKGCQMEVCSSYDIKRFRRSQHYIASQEFCDDKMLYKPHHTPCLIEEDIDKIGKLHCKNCDKDWGIINKYEGQLFPVIKITSFTGRDCEEPVKRKPFRKWSEVPFKIDDVESVDENLFIDTTQ